MWKLFQQNKKMIDETGFRFAKLSLAGKKIVIADDNGGTLKWLKYTLEEYHAIVYTFKHGQETIDFLKNEHKNGSPVDGLILDIHMNKVGGLEIAKFNVTSPKPSFAMFLTGCREDSEEFKQASQLSTVLQKPVDIEKILSVLMQGLLGNFEASYEEYKQNIATH